MRKRVLLFITLFIVIAGVACAMIPFASALSPSARARNNATTVVELDAVQFGELKEFSIDGRPLFILKPNHEQWVSIRKLDSYVWDRRMPAWSKELGAFVYWGLGTRWGFKLQMMPPQNSGLLDIYASDDRSQWFPGGTKPVWQSGYWNSHDEASYDYAGRAIRDWEHTYNGFDMEVPNLNPAHVSLIEPGKLAVYRY